MNYVPSPADRPLSVLVLEDANLRESAFVRQALNGYALRHVTLRRRAEEDVKDWSTRICRWLMRVRKAGREFQHVEIVCSEPWTEQLFAARVAVARATLALLIGQEKGALALTFDGNDRVNARAVRALAEALQGETKGTCITVGVQAMPEPPLDRSAVRVA